VQKGQVRVFFGTVTKAFSCEVEISPKTLKSRLLIKFGKKESYQQGDHFSGKVRIDQLKDRHIEATLVQEY